MTLEEKQAMIADLILSMNVRPLPAFPSAPILRPDFTRKRHIRRTDATLPCAVLQFPPRKRTT